MDVDDGPPLCAVVHPHGSNIADQDLHSKSLCPFLNGQAGTCDACKTLNDLDTRVNQAMAHLTGLLQQRQEARTHLNMAHSPIVSGMPAEVVSSIFEFACAEHCSPLKLGAICRTWRQVAWSNPRLWTTFEIYWGRSMSGASLEVAQKWLERSGRLPLRIVFRGQTYSERGFSDYEHLLPWIRLVNQYSARWGILDLELSISLLEHFGEGSNAPLSLRTLALRVPREFRHGSESSLVIKMEEATPNLVHIEGVPLACLEIQWAHVTTIVASDLLLGDVAQMIRLATTLRDASFDDVFDGPVPFASNSFHPLIHDCITQLEIEFSDLVEDASIVHFFNSLTFPRLVNLDCSIFQSVIPEAALASFFRRSGCPLEDLTIAGGVLTGNGLIEMTRWIPSITSLSLTLSMNLLALSTFFDDFQAHLLNPSDISRNIRGPLLPRLSVFECYGQTAFPWHQLLALFTPLARNVAEGTRPLKALTIYCDAAGGPVPYIDRGTLQVLLQRIRGLDYNFTVGTSRGPSDLIEMSLRQAGLDQQGL